MGYISDWLAAERNAELAREAQRVTFCRHCNVLLSGPALCSTTGHRLAWRDSMRDKVGGA